MAVNTQKLLPSAKTSSALVRRNVSGSLVPSIKTKKIVGPLAKKDEPGKIVKLLTDIDVRLRSLLNEERNQRDTERKQEERKKFDEEEKKLEAPKEAKKFNLPTLSIPGMSFLDRVKRFIFFTALGWLFTKFEKDLPKLTGVIKTITQVYGVAENIFKTLLGGLVNTIDIGYQTYDGLRKKVKELGGKNAEKTFDDFSGHLNKLLNGAIMASMLIASTASKTPKTTGGGAAGYESAFAAGYAAGLASRGKGPRYRAPGEAAAGRTFQENVQRQALTRRGSLAYEGPKGPLDKIFRGFRGASARLETGTLFKGGAGIQRAIYNAPGKLKNLIPKIPKGSGILGRGVRGAGGIPVIGPLLTFGIRTLVYHEKPSKAAAAAIGTGIGQMVGGFIAGTVAGGGTVASGGLGSVMVPFIISAGQLAGALVGEWIGAKLYDFVVGSGNKKLPKPSKPQRKAGGGPVTRGGQTQGGAPSRTLKITKKKKPQKLTPQQSQPGKDVGGKTKIKQLYPDPSAKTEIEGPKKGPWFDLLSSLPENATPKQIQDRDNRLKKLPNPYKALTNTAKILKEIPFGIGALMGGAVDIALGQKLSKSEIKGLSGGISYLIEALANRQIQASVSNIQREITTMQTGGITPQLRDFTRNDNDRFKSDMDKIFNNIIQQKVDAAIREVQKQMMPGKYSGSAFDEPGGGRGQGRGGGEGPIPTGEGLNQPDVKGKGGYQGSTNVIDTGYKDAQGRPIRLNPNAAQAFRSMVSDGMPFNSSDVANTYRDESEYLRLIKEGYNPASNSAHNYGEGADIHGKMNEWIKKNGKKYGWYYVDYPGTHGGHFEWRGNVSTLPRPQNPSGQQPPRSRDPIRDAAGSLVDVLLRPKNRGGRTPDRPTAQQPQRPPGQGTKSAEASWYGPGFYGNKTADGTVLGRNSLWVANKTLPFGTRIKFTYNGKTIILPVKDRGPFHGNREFDFTEAAAEAIRLKTGPNSGTGTVQYEILGKQGGGYIPKQNPRRDTQRLSSYPSYSADGGMMIAIQPMIVERVITVPSRRNRTIAFPIPVGVNNNSMQGLSRG